MIYINLILIDGYKVNVNNYNCMNPCFLGFVTDQIMSRSISWPNDLYKVVYLFIWTNYRLADSIPISSA